MKKTYNNTKIWASTLSDLRIVAALKGEKMTKVIDDLVSKELKKEMAKRAN